MEEKLLKIINHYGVLPQLKYFQSEVFELNEAIIQKEYPALAKDKKPYELEMYEKKHITEEIADVITSKDRSKAGKTMSAHALFMKKVDYDA